MNPPLVALIVVVGAGIAAAAVTGWVYLMTRRNMAIVRPPVLGASGDPLPGGVIEYSDGERVEYVDAGSGQPILWVPGADSPKETFRHQLPHFATTHRVIAADLRSRVTSDHDLDRFVSDLRELVDHLGVDRCFLVGTSLGTAISMRFARLFPERVHGIVLCNPLAYVTHDHVGFNKTGMIPVAMATTRYLPTAISRMLARLWGRAHVWVFDDSPGRDQLIEYVLFTGPRTEPPTASSRRVGCLKRLDLRPDLPRINRPALVVKGLEDTYCPVSWAHEIVDKLPSAEFLAVPGTGHCTHISMPEVVNRAIRDWLWNDAGPVEEAEPPSEPPKHSSEQLLLGIPDVQNGANQ